MIIKEILIDKSTSQTNKYNITVKGPNDSEIIKDTVDYKDLSGTRPANIPFNTFPLLIDNLQLSVFIGKMPVPPPLSDGSGYTEFSNKGISNPITPKIINFNELNKIHIINLDGSPYFSVELSYKNISPIISTSINPRIIDPSDTKKMFPRFIDIVLNDNQNDISNVQIAKLNTKFYLKEKLAIICRNKANSYDHPYTSLTTHFAHFVIKIH